MEYFFAIILVVVIGHGINGVVTREINVSFGKRKGDNSVNAEDEVTTFTGSAAVVVGVVEAVVAAAILIFVVLPDLLRH